MVNFTVDEIRMMMDKPRNIRNLSVIAHVDHGKSTLTDSLIGAAGIIAASKAGDARFMDTRADEQDRTITIKSTAVSLSFAIDTAKLNTLDMKEDAAAIKKAKKAAAKKGGKKAKKGKKVKKKKMTAEEKAAEAAKPPVMDRFLINLIDSPGHVDFSSEVTAALRVTDGALVVVDCVEGVCVQTETVLRQAIAERIKPILFVNKLDRVFLELMMEPEECYQMFSRAIESVNVVIATYNDELLGDVQVYPEEGTVGFGSGLHSWGFTIGVFAKFYSQKWGIPQKKLMSKLWGNNYYNVAKSKWTSKQFVDGKQLERGFCKFIMAPMTTLTTAVMNKKDDIVASMVDKLSINLPKSAKEETGKTLLKSLMRVWLPAADTLLEMIVNHLPSPAIAQKYRLSNLYSGPLDDECALDIRNCNPDGHLMMYVSKMVPTSEKGRFYAFGRVFSGTVATGKTVRIMGPDYVPGKKTDLYVKKIQRTVLMMGGKVEQMPDCPCGNIIGLVGIDQYLLKAGTISTWNRAHNFVTMKYSVSPVVRVAVEVKNASDLPKLMEGLKRLSKSDPLVQTFTAPTGEHIVAGAGELHLEICIKDLRDDFMKGAPLIMSDPVVSFCETVTEESDTTCCAKSPNKHNRIYLVAEPLEDEVVRAMVTKDITQDQDQKKRARMLADEYKWDVAEARKIWSFGCPPDGIPNMLIDGTKGVQFLNEVKDSLVGAFLQTTCAGILCEEALRGIKFTLVDLTMHADAIHRGAGQMMPPMKRAMYASQINSGPALLEPLYLCDITVPQNAVSGVYSTLSARRGMVETTEQRPGTPLCKVKGYLPVLESFGFTNALRANTSGQAFPQMIFSHWQKISGDMYEEGSQVHSIAMDVRHRKGMKMFLPAFGDYYDKL